MTSFWQGFCYGLMTALLPSMIYFSWLLWRAPTMREEDEIPDDWRAAVEKGPRPYHETVRSKISAFDDRR